MIASAAHLRASLFAIVALLPSCAAVPPVCDGGAEPVTVAALYFGRNIGDRLGVGEAEWARFVDEDVTPRFPDGLTVADGTGQWKDTATGAVVREPSKVLTLVLPDLGGSRAKLAAVADAYKKRFDQQAVMTVLHPACVSF